MRRGTAGTGLVSVAPLLAAPDGFPCSSVQTFSWGVPDFALGGALSAGELALPTPLPSESAFLRLETLVSRSSKPAAAAAKETWRC